MSPKEAVSCAALSADRPRDFQLISMPLPILPGVRTIEWVPIGRYDLVACHGFIECHGET